MDDPLGGNRWPSHIGSGDHLYQHFYHGHLLVRELRTHTRYTTPGALELLAMV